MTVDQMKPRHGSGINPAIRGILRQDAAGTIGLQENLSYLPEKPDRHLYYITSRQGCQDKWRKNGKKKRRDLHPHPCPDHRPLFFRFHPTGCFELLFFAGHHPGASRKEDTMKTTTRSIYSIPHLRHAVKYFILRLRTTPSMCLHPRCRLP